jgi:hypothetical protein
LRTKLIQEIKAENTSKQNTLEKNNPTTKQNSSNKDISKTNIETSQKADINTKQTLSRANLVKLLLLYK